MSYSFNLNKFKDISKEDEEFFNNSQYKLVVLRRTKLVEKRLNYLLQRRNLDAILIYSLESFTNIIISQIAHDFEKNWKVDNVFTNIHVSKLFDIYIRKKYKDKIIYYYTQRQKYIK